MDRKDIDSGSLNCLWHMNPNTNDLLINAIMTYANQGYEYIDLRHCQFMTFTINIVFNISEE